MYQHTNLNDIADELLILNKITVERLYSLKNCADCIALYIFYYKIAYSNIGEVATAIYMNERSLL